MRLLKVGRDKSCNIVLPSPRVSSLHAEIIVLNNGDILLEDRNSLNGTYVMNRPIKPGNSVPIKRGDAVRFADTELNWNMVPLPPDTRNLKAIYGIGKDVRNEVQLTDPTVSRFHATLLWGKDGKTYLEDHSKNGTTVNGNRISSGQKVRVRRKDAIVCGGVTLSKEVKKRYIQGDSILPKLLAALAAAAAILLIVLAVKNCPSGIFDFKRERTDAWIYNRYKNATCLVVGGYHYEVSIPGLDIESLNAALRATNSSNLKTIPTHIVKDNDGNYMEMKGESNLYFGTGFFVSKDGQIVTNLHVAKPWLADIDGQGNLISDGLKQWISSIITRDANYLLINGLFKQDLASYINSIKVEGVLDYIGVVPNAQFFDSDNLEKCRVIYNQGDNLDIDVAMITTINGRLPQGCSFVNIKDSIRTTDEASKVGTHIYTIGFPASTRTQNLEKSKIASMGHEGSITQIRDAYSFGFSATSYHGASGSPIFDKYGYLIGVANSGLGTTGLNYGIKGRYIKEMSNNSN